LLNSDRAIKFIVKSKIPILYLTNNGICTENEKTDEINLKLNLAGEEAINTKNMFVCHTFMGSKEF
jgi:ribonucleotide monophosphatase NagD (HAD superfamily)